MKKPVLEFALLAGLFAAMPALAEKPKYDRYKSIVERQMFGPLPANFDPNKMPNEVAAGKNVEKELTKEQEQLKSSIHFSMVNVTPDGSTAVGFTDNSDPKVPVHYYLKVGEERGGWIVKEADAYSEPPKMTIAKGDIEVALELGANSGKGGGKTSKAGEAKQDMSNQQMNKSGGILGNSLGLRRKRRFDEERAKWKQEREQLKKEVSDAKAKNEEEKAAQEAGLEKIKMQLSEEIKEQMRRSREDNAAKAAEKKGNAENETNDAQ